MTSHISPSRRENGEDIGRKWLLQIVALSARPLRFEIEAILTSFGFDRFRPLRRWRTLSYLHSPAARRLALNESVSNLEGELWEVTA